MAMGDDMKCLQVITACLILFVSNSCQLMQDCCNPEYSLNRAVALRTVRSILRKGLRS
jgi:hypothetical protein